MDDNSLFHQRRNLNYDLNSTVMLAALISLGFVIIMVFVLYIYARCVLGHQARREAALRIIISAAEPPPRTGLDASIIAALPVFTVAKQQQQPSDDGNEMECSVCLSILDDGELGRNLPNCKHTFHAECVDKWFVSNSTCPICRAEAQPRDKVVIVVDAQDETPEDGVLTQPSTPKACGASVSRLSSFRRILSREISSRRLNQTQSNCEQLDIGAPDLERQ